MVEALASHNILPFTAGLGVGIIVGILVGIYIGLHSRNTDDPIVLSNIFGGVMAMLWAGLHTYAIISGDIEISFVFDVVGGLAMGQTLGIDLVSAIQKFRK